MSDIALLESKKFELPNCLKPVSTNERITGEKCTIEKIKLDPKVSFSFIEKNLVAAISSVGPLIAEDNTLHGTAEYMVEIPQEQYCSAFNYPSIVYLVNINENNNLQHTISDISFDTLDIIVTISKITSNSAAGPIRFPTEGMPTPVSSLLTYFQAKVNGCDLYP